jgi:hypothetical protein
MIDRNQYGVTYQLTGMNGGDEYINTIMMFDPKTNLGYVFICNTGSVSSSHYYNINLFRTLASLGDNFIMNDNEVSFWKKINYKWHNIYSRINGLV